MGGINDADGSEKVKETIELSETKPKLRWSKGKHGVRHDDQQRSDSVPFLQLFRFTSYGDRVLLVIALITACTSSTFFPTLNVLCGERTGVIVTMSIDQKPCLNTTGGNVTVEELQDHMNDQLMDTLAKISIALASLGVAEFLCCYLFVSIFRRIAEKMAHRVRIAYFRALLRQDVAWYDTFKDKSFVTTLTDDLDKFQEATGEKIGFFIYNTMCSVVCVLSAFWYGWLLSLVIMASLPVMTIWSYLVSMMQSKFSAKEQREYSKSGAVAQEALANIRTVMAFGGQELEMKRFEKGLASALRVSKRKGLLTAAGNGIMWFLNYATLALTFWYGMKLIFDDRGPCGQKRPGGYGPTEVTIVFFSIMYASFRFGIAISYLSKFSDGRLAAAKIYQVIDRTPPIDSYADTGRNPTEPLKGKVQFRQVRFSYPSRPDVPILRGLDLTIQPGIKVAFVGNSGCGKSTCLQLLQRFYDPDSGSVWVDDINIRDLNLKWYRSNIGVVSQEPVLFDTTIAENIRYGRDDVSQEEIEAACKISNAHYFITKLPKKYDTMVGQRGFQLSGGQKQRIAIARALVRDPKILLLDEATSALDTQSERLVQRALDNASKGRTTLIVAHRLSTIRNADLIVAFDQGKVAEMGTHSELLKQGGIYYQLVMTQMGAEDSLADEQMSEAEIRRQSEQAEFEFAVKHAEEKPEDEEVEKPSLIRLFKFSAEEWPLLTFGLVMAVLNGLVLPAYSYFYGQTMGIMTETDPLIARERTDYYSIVFVIIGICAGLSNFGSAGSFSVAGELLTDRLRKLTFKSMLKQDLEWFDNPKNSVGALCARLSGDAASIQGATGSWLGTVTQAFTTTVVAVAIGFYVLPKLAAAAIVFSPIIFAATYLSSKMFEGQQIEEKAVLEQASKLVYQAVSNIRTVASLCKEDKFVEMYSEYLVAPHRKAMRYSHMLGLVHAISQSSFYFAYAVIAYYGGYLVRYEGVNYSGICVICEGLVWVFFLLGQNLAFAPNYNKGKVAGGRILKLLASKPKIECSPATGLQMLCCDGRVEFDDVEFRYPTRPDAKILKGLSLTIQPRLNIGICGPSGSGKSTCIQLLMRYYDPEAGVVKLDDVAVDSLNVGALRSQMALVSQEPALFDRTLAENIAYGDNRREIDMEEIIQAARAANIHNFIASLPAGYSTKVGEMGSQLSGGQKQRVAIARALIRNPKLLLLDEATSALDAESEKVVQSALDSAAEGRTCITIAHRLTSIQNADRIVVVNNGAVAESGTHEELLRRRGVYYKLWKMQSHQAH